MAIISQQTWDNMPKEEKEWIIQEYNSDAGEGHSMLGKLFGKENLQPKIRTWDDVQESEKLLSINYDRRHTHLTVDNNIVSTKVINKIIATYKIAHLINKGYGGIVTEEENNNEELNKFAPFYYGENGFIIECLYRSQDRVLCFHTQQQAEEFMSYPENVELVKQYYMI